MQTYLRKTCRIHFEKGIRTCNIAAARGGWSGVYIERISKFSDFWYICGKLIVLMRVGGIRAVQKVICDPTQLSGRGFSRSVYMKLFSSQFYICWTHIVCPNCHMLTHCVFEFIMFDCFSFLWKLKCWKFTILMFLKNTKWW